MSYANYPYGEISRRGEEIYAHDIRDLVEKEHKGKILVIDIETGDYEIDGDAIEAAHRAHSKHPDGVFYAIRIGYPAFAKVGGAWDAIKH